jgi:ADP-ribose pyrophosphatase YjhB (NUDIX family)
MTPERGAPAGGECAIHRLIADICVVAEDHVLLVRYDDTAGHDGHSGWFLPDALLEHGEPPEQTAALLLHRQAGIEVTAPFLSHVESFIGGGGRWHLAFHYVAQLPARPRVTPGPGVREAAWFDLVKLPSKKETAHGGWALQTIREILLRASG